jgi:SRSO17 transposase
MGCAGGVENGINTVHLSYVREGVGHALIGARQWIPAGQIDDPVTSVVTALPLDLRFRTKGQLAIDVLAGAFADGIALDFVTGDEVYGSCTELREYLEKRGQGYVLRVPSNFRVTLARGVTATAAAAIGQLSGHLKWEVRSAGTGSKGQRWYAWAHVATASPRHSLLIRRHLATGELAYHCCYAPEGQPAGTTRLIRAAGLRWPVEEDFEFGKDCFGLDQSQVRLYHAIARHTVLVMAALAICAVTAALLKARTGTHAPPPVRPGQSPPADPGMIPLTVPEVRRLLAIATSPALPPGHTIHWSNWTRTHQARANWFHQRTRLERDQQITMKPLAS